MCVLLSSMSKSASQSLKSPVQLDPLPHTEGTATGWYLKSRPFQADSWETRCTFLSDILLMP